MPAMLLVRLQLMLRRGYSSGISIGAAAAAAASIRPLQCKIIMQEHADAGEQQEMCSALLPTHCAASCHMMHLLHQQEP
jgi:TRAP-type mannitol/chloroaromatic compound transport system permease large subunit